VRTELAARLDPSRGLCAVGWDRTLQTDRQTDRQTDSRAFPEPLASVIKYRQPCN